MVVTITSVTNHPTTDICETLIIPTRSEAATTQKLRICITLAINKQQVCLWAVNAGAEKRPWCFYTLHSSTNQTQSSNTTATLSQSVIKKVDCVDLSLVYFIITSYGLFAQLGVFFVLYIVSYLLICFIKLMMRYGIVQDKDIKKENKSSNRK